MYFARTKGILVAAIGGLCACDGKGCGGDDAGTDVVHADIADSDGSTTDTEVADETDATSCAPGPESDESLCARFAWTCGELTATDNCGVERHIASCGACAAGPDTTCATHACADGVCSVVSQLTRCDGECVDTTDDLDHCGGCRQTCSGTCASSVCYPDVRDTAAWEAFDLSKKHPTDNRGLGGAIFDGRYVIYAPFDASAVGNYTGLFHRYDTHAAFTETTSWEIFDPSDLISVRSFDGVAFDGRYAYFAPYLEGKTALRFDTTGSSFASTLARTTFSLNSLATPGYSGAGFARGQVLLAPAATGRVPRFAVGADFSLPASWSTFDTGAELDARAVGFGGATTDGRYVYLAPGFNGSGAASFAVRYDATQPFADEASWEWLDFKDGACAACRAEAVGYAAAVFDGRYVYFVPGVSAARTTAWVMRFDTSAGSFSEAAAWSGFDTTRLSPGAKAFSGAAFDGRRLYLVPNSAAYNGQLLVVHDTGADFASTASWTVFDTSTLPGKPSGFDGAAFDGSFVYLVPSDTTLALRFLARSPAALAPWQPGYHAP